MADSVVSAEDWMKGIALSVLASVIGGASKLAIRKSWLLEDSTDSPHAEVGRNDPLEVDEMCLEGTGHFEKCLIPTRRMTDDTADMSIVEDDLGNGLVLNDSLSEDCPVDIEERHTHTMIQETASTKNWLAVSLRTSGMLGMTLLNPLCCVLAMNYASPSILAPFSGLTLVWIVLFAGVCVGETPSSLQVSAASLIVAGEVIVAVFGDHTNDEGATTSDVRESYKHAPFLAYIAVAALWFMLLAHWMQCPNSSPMLRRFAWGVSGGSCTGFQNFLKDSLTLIKASGDGDSVHWALLLVFVGLAVGTSLVGLLLLTACMKRYDATYSATMFVGSFVLSASIMSAVHYDTFSHLDETENKILYPAGLLTLMSGVYLLATEPDATLAEEEEPRAVMESGATDVFIADSDSDDGSFQLY